MANLAPRSPVRIVAPRMPLCYPYKGERPVPATPTARGGWWGPQRSPALWSFLISYPTISQPAIPQRVDPFRPPQTPPEPLRACLRCKAGAGLRP